MKKAERKKLNAYVLIVKDRKDKIHKPDLALKGWQRSMSFRHWRAEPCFCVLNTERPQVHEYYKDRCTLLSAVHSHF